LLFITTLVPSFPMLSKLLTFFVIIGWCSWYRRCHHRRWPILIVFSRCLFVLVFVEFNQLGKFAILYSRDRCSKHRVMNYIEAPIALPLSLDNEAMMPPRRKMLISPLFDKFDRNCNSFPPHSAPLLLTVLFLFLIEIPIPVASHLS